ncbi:multiple sugar transport system substrate-binding protein [Microbacterium halimionae]|uniref:Multiple sugar transport system substrate-binding protein n=1 Tax=Microbacterium halimionae TaxID=1526413 RepID=A0A7W3PM28_9MICO|nr:extracellular solute-binding protein [Microbacterium halimionae]MBA8816778.1 multiple sugar transport system substrate-binding protein [Microbacterium halimionae]NII94926.1 multiple sugar transport system substrate-binding protein [Microbacterium halimionae]
MNAHISRRDLLRVSALGLGSAALVGLAACAPTPRRSSAATPSSGGTPTDFSFGSWSLSEDAAKGPIQSAMKTFATQDGITISPVTYPYNDYLNQLTLQVRGGQFAGAAQLDVAWLSALAALGKLDDLSSYAAGRDYTSAALGAGQYDGVQYGLPWTIGAIGLIANKELYDKAGASLAPTTIDEFEDGLRALKGIGVIPYAASTKAAQLKDILVWMQTFGSPVIEDGKTTIGDEASVKAVEWYKKLYDDGLIAPDVDRAAARTLFAQGATALYDDAPVGKSAVVSQSPDSGLSAKMTPMARPVLSRGDTSQNVLWGHLVVVVDGAGAGTAADYAQWLTSNPEQTVSYFEALGLPPTTTTALESDAVTSNTFVNEFTSRITATAKPSPLWVYPSYGQMETAIADQVQAVLIGQSTAAKAMGAAGAAVSRLIG